MTKRSRQPDSYIRMFDALQKNEDDNSTPGIILCSEPNAAIAPVNAAVYPGNRLFIRETG